ncbi:MAG TPA: ATPase with chaperone activity [Rhizobacter sp.]|nr:ATPase with chaperone activity [Rhizobacter sp.]
MSDDNQIEIPPSFIALFVPPGRIKPTAPRAEIQQRYEYCEDLAGLLTETAQTQLWQLGITEGDVLERIHAGMLSGEAGVSEAEAVWVTRRLAELLGWDDPLPLAAGA